MGASGYKIDETCETCHVKYLPKQQDRILVDRHAAHEARSFFTLILMVGLGGLEPPTSPL
jgi:hypothetical protein